MPCMHTTKEMPTDRGVRRDNQGIGMGKPGNTCGAACAGTALPAAAGRVPRQPAGRPDGPSQNADDEAPRGPTGQEGSEIE